MFENYRDLLLNIFLVFLPITLYVHVFKTNRTSAYRSLMTFLFFCPALILTMTFPVEINGSSFDFRAVPVAIGSLYGGWNTSLMLYAALLLYRFINGSAHPFQYIIAAIPTFFMILWFTIKFHKFTLVQKILSSVAVYLIVRVSILVLYFYLTDNVRMLKQFASFGMIETIVLQGIITGLYVYLLELFLKNARLQDEVIKSEKMRVVSDIAASVAHEVRNPLTSVRGFIQLMGKQDLTAESRQYYKTICLDELDRAQQIISDYLTFAKPEPEKIDTIHLNHEIEYVANVLLSYANYQNVQVITQLPDEVISVLGDKYKLRQALINIGKNGIEAMPDGGQLTFTLRRTNRALLITITDTGVGMTAEQVNRLGTPYYSTKDKGTGLGTMVSFSIIRKMQGNIEVTSEKGKGTVHLISFDSK